MKALDVLCAQLTRDLFAIAKFLLIQVLYCNTVSSLSYVVSCNL